MSENAIQPYNSAQEYIDLVKNSLVNEHSKRAYEKAVSDFFAWYQAQGKAELSKAVVQEYKGYLSAQGLAPSTVNLRMSAIRKLALEAADNGQLGQIHANGIANVTGIKTHGTRAGNWLDKDQAQALINSPDTLTLKGLRDRAILAVMIGAGLRRSEVAALNFPHVQQREGRWVIVDLVGKGNRVRTVPIPSWCKVAIDEWATGAALTGGALFRSVNKGGFISGDRMTPQAVRDVVKLYAGKLGFDLAAHDLRRTFAKLAHKGGSVLEQIQLSLGHASIKTTERYLGVNQDLVDAPCDRLGLRLA